MSRLILPRRNLIAPSRNKQRGYVVLDAYRGAAGGAAPSDPYFANVALLLHFDGANGSTTFTDSSSHGRTATVYGDSQLSTTSPLVGSASGLFDGSGDYIAFAENAADIIGTGAFCLEASFIATSLSGNNFIAFNGPLSFDTYEWAMFTEGAGFLHFYRGYRGYNQWHLRLLVPATLITGTRYDVFLGRDVAGNWYGGVNGTLCTQYQHSPSQGGISYGSVTTGTFVDATNILGGSGPLNIGNLPGEPSFPGSLDEVRLTVGQHRYAADYTPTFPFPDS